MNTDDVAPILGLFLFFYGILSQYSSHGQAVPVHIHRRTWIEKLLDKQGKSIVVGT